MDETNLNGPHYNVPLVNGVPNVPSVNGPPYNGPIYNGPFNQGHPNNGHPNNGHPNNGHPNNGHPNNGPLYHGPLYNGPYYNGPSYNGLPYNGPLYNGPPFNGPLFTVPSYNAQAYNAPAFNVPPFMPPNVPLRNVLTAMHQVGLRNGGPPFAIMVMLVPFSGPMVHRAQPNQEHQLHHIQDQEHPAHWNNNCHHTHQLPPWHQINAEHQFNAEHQHHFPQSHLPAPNTHLEFSAYHSSQPQQPNEVDDQEDMEYHLGPPPSWPIPPQVQQHHSLNIQPQYHVQDVPYQPHAPDGFQQHHNTQNQLHHPFPHHYYQHQPHLPFAPSPHIYVSSHGHSPSHSPHHNPGSAVAEPVVITTPPNNSPADVLGP